MKKVLLFSLLVVAAIATTVVLIKGRNTKQASANPDYLRIHIRANSNNDCDQNVKYKVKEKVVEFLASLLCECKTQKEAKIATNNNIDKICEIANKTLKDNGFSYTCRAQVRVENFPTRSYGDLTLDEGCYDALILELGSGKGDNWWCVMFPPLCFVGAEGDGSNGFKYKSKIYELIKKYL